MSIVPLFDSFTELTGLRDPFQDPFFKQFGSSQMTPFGIRPGTPAEKSFPAIDLVETPDAYVVTADLPGMDKKDITVNFHNNTLTIEGESRQSNAYTTSDNLHVNERKFGKFKRSVVIPDTVGDQDIKATHDKGVLRVEVPKSEDKKARKIQIN